MQSGVRGRKPVRNVFPQQQSEVLVIHLMTVTGTFGSDNDRTIFFPVSLSPRRLVGIFLSRPWALLFPRLSHCPILQEDGHFYIIFYFETPLMQELRYSILDISVLGL